MNPCDTIQAGYMIERERLRKENAELKEERRKLDKKAAWLAGKGEK